jgi:multiple sugar transport system ATP-binding protein
MNLVEATIENDEVTFGQYRVPLATPRQPGKVVLGIRPESFEDAAFAPGLPTLNVVVEVVEDLGSDAHVFFHVDAKPVTAEVLEAHDESILAGNQALFTARVDVRTRAQIGGRLDVAVDASRFHFFDPATGDRLGADARELATA